MVRPAGGGPCYHPPPMQAKEPKSVQAMTDAERRALISRRPVQDAATAMEIGGDTPVRRTVRAGGRLLAWLGLAAVFVVLFFRFTASWRVALIVVGLMGVYMLIIGRMVEGRTDRLD